LAVFGGYERYEGDLAIGADAEGLRRVKPVRMPDLPPTHGSDPLEDEQPEIEIGENTVEELAEARKGLIAKALKAGLPTKHAPAMRDLVDEFQDIFRIRLDDSPHADVAPMGADVQPDIKPSKAPPRHYNPRQRSFISTYCDKLLSNKLAVKIKTSDWVSPPLLVKKYPPAYFRFTLDLRGPNYATRKHDFVMPDLEEELAKLSGATYFAKLDFAQDFWQPPTDWEAALLFAFRGVDGLYTSTRVPHGAKNSAQWFQLVTSECFKELLYCLRQWIDDFLLHTKTVQGVRAPARTCVINRVESGRPIRGV
jgi:hypothetical protein